MNKNTPQMNALRLNVNPHTLAYLDAVIDEQDIEIDRLIKQNLALQQEIAECRLLIQDINSHLDTNVDYSLTKAKVVRLMKKLGIT